MSLLPVMYALGGLPPWTFQTSRPAKRIGAAPVLHRRMAIYPRQNGRIRLAGLGEIVAPAMRKKENVGRMVGCPGGREETIETGAVDKVAVYIEWNAKVRRSCGQGSLLPTPFVGSSDASIFGP